jgi:TctA family transporter
MLHENSVTLRTVAAGTCFGMIVAFLTVVDASQSSTLPKNATSDLVTASFLVKRQAVGRHRF